MAGRKIVFELDPLSFNEFLRFKGDRIIRTKANIGSIADILEGRFDPSINLVENDFAPYLYEYLVFGGCAGAGSRLRLMYRDGFLNSPSTGFSSKHLK